MSLNPLFDDTPASPADRLSADSPLRSALESLSNRVEESQAANALLAEQVIRLADQLAAVEERLLASSASGCYMLFWAQQSTACRQHGTDHGSNCMMSFRRDLDPV